MWQQWQSPADLFLNISCTHLFLFVLTIATLEDLPHLMPELTRGALLHQRVSYYSLLNPDHKQGFWKEYSSLMQYSDRVASEYTTNLLHIALFFIRSEPNIQSFTKVKFVKLRKYIKHLINSSFRENHRLFDLELSQASCSPATCLMWMSELLPGTRGAARRTGTGT